MSNPVDALFEEPKPKPRKPKIEWPSDYEPVSIEVGFDKLTMDEVRAYYIIICKKRPKHDSKHTKGFLIKEIINKLKNSI